MAISHEQTSHEQLLSRQERARRYARLRGLMAEHDLDVLVIVGRDGSGTRGDLRYVASYAPVAPFLHFAVFPRAEAEPVFFSRLASRSPLASKTGWVNETKTSWLGLEDAILDEVETFRGSGKVGFARLETIPVPLYLALIERHGRERVCDAGDVLDRARMIKSGEEIECARRAAHATDAAYEFLRDFVKPGRSDREVYGQARRIMHESGAEYSMDLISCDMAGGFAPVGISVGKDGFLAMEVTPAYLGYYNQLRFEFRFGRAAVERAKAVDVLHEAYDAAVATICPGVTSSELYGTTLEVIQRNGFSGGAGHFGHGLGLDVAEGVSVEPGDDIKLQPGMVFVFHPKIMPGNGPMLLLGGSFLVTEDGYEALNQVPVF